MPISRKLTGFLAVVFCLTALVAAAGDEDYSTSIQQAPCCFENPRFSGTCEVTPGEGESCGTILGYLNNPNSMGKDYCGNTNIRGGWSQVNCEGAASVADQCTVDLAVAVE
jgi:hypothetical protein